MIEDDAQSNEQKQKPKRKPNYAARRLGATAALVALGVSGGLLGNRVFHDAEQSIQQANHPLDPLEPAANIDHKAMFTLNHGDTVYTMAIGSARRQLEKEVRHPISKDDLLNRAGYASQVEPTGSGNSYYDVVYKDGKVDVIPTDKLDAK